MKRTLWALFLCALILLSAIPTASASTQADTATEAQAQAFFDGILAFHTSKENTVSIEALLDGALSSQAGKGAEWTVFALAQSGESYSFAAYESALLSYLDTHTVTSAASRQKYALCLAAVGSTDPYIRTVMNEAIGQNGIMSLIYGLHLFNNGYLSNTHTEETVIRSLLPLQCADGGWALSGESGDVDVTAMAVQALAPYYETHTLVKDAVDRALALLSSRQLEDGDYASYGVANPESTAQVLVALCSLNIDCASDARFLKNGSSLFDGIAKYRLPDGSFCHTVDGSTNPNATAQVLYASLAYLRMAKEASPLYLLDRADPAGARAPSAAPPASDAAPVPPAASDEPPTESDGIGYKPVVTVILLVAAGAACLILLLRKKGNAKNLVALLIVLALAVTLVWVTDLRAPDRADGNAPTKENPIGTVTVSIRCDTVAGRADTSHIPENGILLAETSLLIEEGDTVYDILCEAAKQNGIKLTQNASAGTRYITGIGELYEFDFGDLSGWIYHVNGVSSSVGCDAHLLADGDSVVWHYTCALGQDIK